MKPYNFVFNIIMLLLCRGLQAFYMFILGQLKKMYYFIFLTKTNLSSFLEPPIVSYFNPYKAAVNLSVKGALIRQKLKKGPENRFFRCVAPGHRNVKKILIW